MRKAPTSPNADTAPAQTSADTDDRPSFETTLRELETLVDRLEGGELALEDSLSLFERGMKLAGHGNEILDAAEKRVEILLRNRQGELEPAPFDEGA